MFFVKSMYIPKVLQDNLSHTNASTMGEDSVSPI